MYKWGNSVHVKKFSISLSVDVCLIISLQVLAAYPSLHGCPRTRHQEEPLDWKVRQSRSKWRSQRERGGSSCVCVTCMLTTGNGQETGSYWGKEKHTTSYCSPKSLPQTPSSLHTHWYTPSVPSPAQLLWGQSRLCNLLRSFPPWFSIISAFFFFL